MNNEEFFYIAVQKTLNGRKGEREKGRKGEGVFFCALLYSKGKARDSHRGLSYNNSD